MRQALRDLREAVLGFLLFLWGMPGTAYAAVDIVRLGTSIFKLVAWFIVGAVYLICFAGLLYGVKELIFGGGQYQSGGKGRALAIIGGSIFGFIIFTFAIAVVRYLTGSDSSNLLIPPEIIAGPTGLGR